MITTLFIDIGGVLGTNGWDRHSRKKAVDHFGLDHSDFEERHKRCYDLLEVDAITLDEYLSQTIFHQVRSFPKENFIAFMRGESKPDWDMIRMIGTLKEKYSLHVAALSNESREIAEYRIHLFDLKSIIDTFFVSAFIHLQKPDPRFYHLALDVSQVKPAEVLYIDDRPQLVKAAAALHIAGIPHVSLEETKRRIETDAS